MTERRPSVSRDRWLVSYADFMTLLCAFFTTLYASSLVDASKEAPAAVSIAASVEAPVEVEIPLEAPPVHAVPPVEDPMQTLRGRLGAALADEIAAGRLQLGDDRRGLVLEVPEAAAFEAGQAELTPAARETMRRIGGALADLPNALRIEGHTDDAPIRTARFASNWELSTARATEVLALFARESAIAPARLSAAGYGEHRPRAGNETAEGRARNRRVDIVVLNPVTEVAEEPSAAEGEDAR